MYLRKKTKRLVVVLLIVFLFMIILGFFTSWYFSPIGNVVQNKDTLVFNEGEHFKVYENYEFLDKEYDLKNYKKMDIFVSPERVTMRDECYVIGVATTLEKTEKLVRSSEKEFLVRPEEHDLLEEIMSVFDIKLDYVAIDKVEEDIFYGHMVVYDDNMVLNLDIRPSDGIAIALRTDSPVYVSNEIIEKFAENKCKT